MKKYHLHAFINFRAEWQRLKRIYHVTMYSYEETLKRVEEEAQSGILHISDCIYYKEELIARSYRELNRNLEVRFANMTRESLFIRLVSLLELYFNDSLIELSNKTFEPFKSQDEKTFKVGQLLSLSDVKSIQNEIIQNQVRSIVLGGFDRIKRFYNSKIDIDFTKSGVYLKDIEKIYSNRNLLVHAGGVIDEVYIRKYGNEDMTVGRRIEITEEFFLSSLETVFKLVQYVTDKLEEDYDFVYQRTRSKDKETKKKKKKDFIREAELVGTFKSIDDIHKYLDEQLVYGFSEKYRLCDILINKTILDNNIAKWTIRGDREKTGAYLGYLRQLKRRGYIESVDKVNESKTELELVNN
ncbi:hypothetical protein COE99_09535 [Bacillus toyonensis]|uniref:hypothetical protein n=1 Tax=Bacillus toyonensis TaxID=155322 RepID=UPI000BFCE108|nr:hypothetical protein [Bacillus toyonensis]PHC09937.1 hypothetical protein COE99_09535 [Bacillus toyonensis]